MSGQRGFQERLRPIRGLLQGFEIGRRRPGEEPSFHLKQQSRVRHGAADRRLHTVVVYLQVRQMRHEPQEIFQRPRIAFANLRFRDVVPTRSDPGFHACDVQFR